MNRARRRATAITKASLAAVLAACLIWPSAAVAETDTEPSGESAAYVEFPGRLTPTPSKPDETIDVSTDAELQELEAAAAVWDCIAGIKCEVEPNNSRATANQVGTGATIAARTSSSTGAAHDDDYFEFVITEPRRVALDFTFSAGHTGTPGDALAYEFTLSNPEWFEDLSTEVFHEDRNGEWLRSIYFYLEPGTYYVRISGNQDLYTWGEPYTLTISIPQRPFVDVSPNPGPTFSEFDEAITWMSASGISTGYPVRLYKPFNAVARDAMAAFLYRFAGEPDYTPPVRSPFRDVPTNHMFYLEIAWLAETGISTGWNVNGGKEFRPSASITRDAMAAFLYRFSGEPTYTPPATSPFTDVAKTQSFYKEISWLADTGITTGWDVNGKKQFRPYNAITRDAMAAFLFRYWWLLTSEPEAVE